MSRSRVITSSMDRSSSVSNWRSRLVMMPTSRPSSSTMGTPLIENRAHERMRIPQGLVWTRA